VARKPQRERRRDYPLAWYDEGASNFLFTGASFYGAGTFCANAYRLTKGSKVYDVVYLSGSIGLVSGQVDIYKN
jgi:hypothetical protein